MYTSTPWCFSKPKQTPSQCLLEKYLRHPKMSYVSALRSGMRLTFGCTKWGHGENLITGAKNHKKVETIWKVNTTPTIAAFSMVQICNSSIRHFKYFQETQVENLRFECEREHNFIKLHKVNKALRGLFLTFSYQNDFCPSTYDFCHC